LEGKKKGLDNKLEADKNPEILEKQLKTLGQKIRIDVLKRLNINQNPLSFSMLQKEVLGSNPNSINFSFHLKALKESKLIDSSDEGYTLNILGKQILKNILSIEQILYDQNKTTMIRTSKYSKEPFNATKIEEYLVKEGQVESFLAKQLAREVEERLSKANIQYLTAPLMREYINAILLENGLEEVRHKLTRLGTPPFEVSKIFNNIDVTADKFLNKLGSDVSEQFLLLNLLPKDLADLYLSGDIALLNLNYWSLRPLSLFVNASTLLTHIKKQYSINLDKIERNKEKLELYLLFSNALEKFIPFISEDLLIGDFNNQILHAFEPSKGLSFYNKILGSQILKLNQFFYDEKPHISLEFSFRNKKSCDGFQIEENFLNSLYSESKLNKDSTAPIILLDTNSSNISDIVDEECIPNFLSVYPCERVVFYKNDGLNLLNSSLINVKSCEGDNDGNNKIILDKVLINLHSIALTAKQNDDLFYDLLQERVNSVFKIFEYKEKLVNKKLKSSIDWNSLISKFFGNNNTWLNDSLRIISFFGLNHAIKTHCGIELDRTETSKTFALNVLTHLKRIIDEKNNIEQQQFIMCQPHKDKYLENSRFISNHELNGNSSHYSYDIIREDSNLAINKKISLYKEFEELLEGGSIFSIKVSLEELNSKEFLASLFNSGIKAFSLKRENNKI